MYPLAGVVDLAEVKGRVHLGVDESAPLQLVGKRQLHVRLKLELNKFNKPYERRIRVDNTKNGQVIFKVIVIF